MPSTHHSRTGPPASPWHIAALLVALLGPGTVRAETASPAQAVAPHSAASAPEAAVAPPEARAPAAALPFLAANGASDRFAVSAFTKTYEEHLLVFASQASSRSPRTLEWLDHQARVAAAAAAAVANQDSSDVHVATGGTGDAATLPPEEKKALEPAKPPVSVGIPSPVAIAGSLAGGLVLLVKLLTAMAR